MHVHELHRRQRIARPVGEVFEFFADAGNLAKLTPAWMHFRILTPMPLAMRAGALIDYSMGWHGLSMRWQTEIVEWSPPARFVDVQRRGPYRAWRHTHLFSSVEGETEMEDIVQYCLPLGPIGRLANRWLVRRDLERIFDFRARRIAELFPPRP